MDNFHELLRQCEDKNSKHLNDAIFKMTYTK